MGCVRHEVNTINSFTSIVNCGESSTSTLLLAVFVGLFYIHGIQSPARRLTGTVYAVTQQYGVIRLASAMLLLLELLIAANKLEWCNKDDI